MWKKLAKLAMSDTEKLWFTMHASSMLTNFLNTLGFNSLLGHKTLSHGHQFMGCFDYHSMFSYQFCLVTTFSKKKWKQITKIWKLLLVSFQNFVGIIFKFLRKIKTEMAIKCTLKFPYSLSLVLPHQHQVPSQSLMVFPKFS